MGYVDLCGITFDISDVAHDFDFVYFTDTTAVQRASLDKNHDGISDLFSTGKFQNQLEWIPDNGCVRINLRECQGNRFNKRCGYAMISIQPKPGLRGGSARIPIYVTAKCPPNGADCSKSYAIVHKYSNCVTQLLPDLIVQKRVDPVIADYKNEFIYTIIVQNTTKAKSNTVLVDTLSAGTNGGTLVLSEIKIDCPSEATCTLSSMTNNEIQISFTDFPRNGTTKITYTRKVNTTEIPDGEVSYFTNTATLSSGSSSQVTVGVKGTGDLPPRRPERPKRTQRVHPFDR